MNNIAVIGAGNIGRRHLQALSNLNNSEMTLFAVDPSSEALDLAKKLYEDVKSNHSPVLHFIDQVSDLPNNMFTVIVATSSYERATVTKTLLSLNNNIKYIIFEKVLFQDLADYHEVTRLLNMRKIKSWVNCFRRGIVFYQNLKEKLKDHELISFSVRGNNWGISSNAIHFIDLIHYLNYFDNYKLTSHDFQILESKRRGYYDLIGGLEGTFGGNNAKLFFESNNHNKDVTFETVLEYSNKTIIINDDGGWWAEGGAEEKLSIISKKKITMRIPYQSEMTQIHINDLIKYGECNLTEFSESSGMHLTMIKYFTKIFSSNNIVGCPIT
jgi:hypothetical protein